MIDFYTPYTLLAPSLATSDTLSVSHPLPMTPATNSAVQGIISECENGSLDCFGSIMPYTFSGTI